MSGSGQQPPQRRWQQQQPGQLPAPNGNKGTTHHLNGPGQPVQTNSTMMDEGPQHAQSAQLAASVRIFALT